VHVRDHTMSGQKASLRRPSLPLFPALLPMLVALVLAVAPLPGAEMSDAEVRGLWVVRSSLTAPGAIVRMVADARAAGFNTLLVQVRGRGDAYYASALEPRAAALAQQPADFDPLAAVLREAHAAGLRVHAWVNLNLVASAQELPGARTHVVNRRPDWLMVPRALAQELATSEPASPAYVGKLARWSRAQSHVEGLYASPLVPAAADHAVAVVQDLAGRYAIDGLHLDYIRYPGPEFDFSRTALAEFRASILPDLTSEERQRLDARFAIDPFAYTDFYPTRWAAFRRSRLTALLMRARTAVKSVRPDATVSVAVFPDADVASTTKLQDWRLWAESGLVDVICPMAYTQDRAQFAEQIAEATRVTPAGARVWAGIGAYRLSPAETVGNIVAARRAGAAGFVLFSYDSLIDPASAPPDYLGQVGRAAFNDRATAGEMR
jgi:uncharacterized lipoprotein YddW (UPF0748 family)